MNWRRIGKWAGVIAGTTIAVVLLAFFALYFALRTPGFYQTALPWLAPYLEDEGVTVVHLGSARIDLLGTVVVRDLEIRWRDADGSDINVIIGSFDLGFSPASILSQLTLDHAQLQNLSITGRVRSTTTETPATDWEQLLEAPLPILADAFKVENVQVDLRLEDDTQWQHFRGTLQEASGALAWSEKTLEGSAHLAVAPDDEHPWQLQLSDGSDEVEASFVPSVGTDAAWRMSHKESRWRLQDLTFTNRIQLPQTILYAVKDGKKQPAGRVDGFTLDAHGNAATVGDTGTGTGLAAMFPLKVEAGMATQAGVDIEGLNLQGLALATRANHELHLDLNGRFDLQDAAPVLHIAAKQQLSVDKLDAAYDGQHLSLAGLTWRVHANGDNTASGPPTTSPAELRLEINAQAARVSIAREATPQDGRIEAAFKPQLSTDLTAKIGSLADLANTLALRFNSNLDLNGIALTLESGKQAEHYRIACQSFAGLGNIEKGHLDWDGSLDLAKISLPQVQKAFSLHNHIHAKTDARLAESTATWQIDLDQRRLASLNAEVHNHANTLHLQHDVQIALGDRLSRYDPALGEALRLTGPASVAWKGSLQLQHGGPDLQSADLDALADWPASAQGLIKITQQHRPSAEDGIALSGPLAITYDADKKDAIRTHLQVSAPGVQVAPLEQPVPIQFVSDSRFSWPLALADTRGDIRIDSRPALSYHLVAYDRPKHLRLDADVGVFPDAAWQRYLSPLKELQAVGGLDLDLKLGADVTHPFDSVLDADPEHAAQAKASVTIATRVTPHPDQSGDELRLGGPVVFNQDIKLSSERLSWDGRFALPQLEIPKQVAIDGLSGTAHFEAGPVAAPVEASATAHLEPMKLRLLDAGGDMELGPLLTPLELDLAAQSNGDRVDLQRLGLRMGDDFVQMAAQGNASVDGKNIQLDSFVTANPRPNLLTQPELSGSGSVEMPWHLTVIDGEQVTVDGEMRFADVDITFAPYRVLNINGSLKIEEELLWTADQKLDFRYLLRADPFQRVDFGRIQPYLDERPVLRVAELGDANTSAGPILASTLLKQNLLSLQHFDLELYGGHVTGQLYLDATPGAWKVGLLSRLSRLDPRLLHPVGSKQRSNTYAPLSMRTAVEFDVNKRLMEGRMDISEISREQLLQLLEVVDPQYQDEQLAKVRAALRLAYPTFVAVTMGRGLMDLEVGISALPNPIQVRGLPLTPLIQHFAGEVLEDLEQVPLEQNSHDQE